MSRLPVSLSRLELGVPLLVHNPVVRGNRQYLAHSIDGLRVVDISNPSAPREVAVFLPPVDAPHVHGVAVAGGLVVVTDSHAGLFVLRHGS